MKKITYCCQKNQLDICNGCARNFKLLLNKKLDDVAEMTIFVPRLIPKEHCNGYISLEENSNKR